MTTQHFVMQSAISTATTEAGARASIYMYSLSGCLVALFGPVLGGLTTIASMVATINSIVFGAAIALAAIHLLRVPMLAAVAAGAAAAAALVAGFYAYQTFRLRDALTADTGVSQQSGKPPP